MKIINTCLIVVAALLYAFVVSSMVIPFEATGPVHTYLQLWLFIFDIAIIMAPWAVACGLKGSRYSFLLAIFLAGVAGESFAWYFCRHEVAFMIVDTAISNVIGQFSAFLSVFAITNSIANKRIWIL